jgi:hypothetical protein
MTPRKYKTTPKKKITPKPYRGYVSRDRARVMELERELDRAYRKIDALQRLYLETPAQDRERTEG